MRILYVEDLDLTNRTLNNLELTDRRELRRSVYFISTKKIKSIKFES